MDMKTMQKLSYGLFVLTAKDGEKDNGCIINTGIQVTSDPNRICFAVNKSNYTHDIIFRTHKLTLSVISEDADFELFKRFGFASGLDVDKFADFTDFKVGYNGLKYITKGTNAFISAWVEQAIDLGSHTLFIAAVTDMEVLSNTPSATYSFYHENIKTKPSNTPAKSGTNAYICTICGHVYEGESLPEDYICPLCKHPASDFAKISD